jgi:hypothetical protein
MNGPTVGRDVFVPIDAVIGGVDGIGHGWRMLMECLSAGRAAEAVRLRRWGDVRRGVVLDEGQREREASRRRRAWLAAAVPGLAAVAAVRGGRWRRSRS